MERQQSNRWKIVAIIFIALFIAENLYLAWAVWYTVQEEQKTYDCYYNTCAEYPEAMYRDGVCSCYDYDVLGELFVAETEYSR